MSILDGILLKLKASLEAQTDLTGINVFQREPLKQDDPVGIYLWQGSSSPGALLDLVSTNQVIRLNVELRFEQEGRTLDENDTDEIVALKSKYADAVRLAVRMCKQGQTYEMTGIYHNQFVSENLHPETKKGDTDMGDNQHRIISQFDFFTFGE